MNRRRAVFALVTVTATSVLTLTIAEYMLRLQTASIRSSDVMDPGLIGYDRSLGWRLQANWQGTHRHNDFTVEYQVNANRVRGPWPQGDNQRVIALLGDSFTFGIGVEEEATFARQLERRLADSSRSVLNLGVPGYSTDQELLLLEETLPDLSVERVLLIVCLINDLFDNERIFPLQAPHGKPCFELSSEGQLSLQNVPVPTREKTAAEMRENLASLVVGDSASRQSSLSKWLASREILRRAGWFQPDFDPPPGHFEQRFSDSLDLFEALMMRIRDTTESVDASFSVVLLPGRSLIASPRTFSARYQDYLREHIGRRADRNGIHSLDLTDTLKAARRSDEGHLYYPHDGHLTPRGHLEVAIALSRADF